MVWRDYRAKRVLLQLTNPNDCACEPDEMCSRCIPGTWLDHWCSVWEDDDWAGADVDVSYPSTSMADAPEPGGLSL